MSGPLDFDILIRDTEFERQISRIENRVMGMSRKVVKETSTLDDQFRKLAITATGLFTFGQLSQLPMQLIKVRGEFQQLEVAYRTLLGNKEKADQLLADSTELAARTPFDLRQVGQGAKQLLAYGFGVEKIIPTLTKLGDISAGTGDDLNHLILVYGTLRAQGRAYARDIMQFTSAGVPMLDALSKTLGVSVEKVNELVSAGKVGFPEVEKAMFSLTDKGSMFGGMMVEQSKTLTGMTSNLSDEWDKMLNEIGKSNQGILAGSILLATGLVENYQPVLDTLTLLVATYGAYKTAVITTMVVEQAAAVAKNVKIWWALAQSIRSAGDAQALFNLTTGLNPYVVAATALVGLITVVALYRSELSRTEQAQQDINDAREESNVKVAEEKAKIESLITTINNDKLSREDRNKKLKELIALSPDHLKALTLDSIKTQEGAAAIDGYVDALKRKFEQEQLNKKLTESFQREADAKAGKNELSFIDKIKYAAASAGGEGTYDYEKETASAKTRLNKEVIADEKAYQEKLKQEQKLLDERGAAAAKAGAIEQKTVAKTVGWYNEQIKALKESQELSTGSKQYNNYQKQIDAMTKSRNRITGAQTAAEKKAAKEADKVGPYGSLSYWDNVAKKAGEVLEKLPDTDKGKIAQQLAIKADAEQRAAEIRKSQEIKTFDEELEERKKQYELYTKWVQFVDQDSADVRYSDLLSKGRTYVDYLNNEIARLEAKQKDGGLSKKDGDNLLLLNTQRDEATGRKTAIQVFSENLETARDKAVSLTDYLAELQRQQDELAGNNTDFGLQARKIIAEEMLQAQRQRRQQLQQFLADVTGSEQQQTATRKRYADMRSALDAEYTDKRSVAYRKAMALIDKAERDELKEVRERNAQAREEFKKLDDVIVERGRAALRKRLELLKKYLESASAEEQKSQTFIGKQKEADDLKIEIDKFTLDDVRTFASIAGELGDALSNANGALGQTGGLLSGLAANASLVTVVFDKNAETSDKVAAGAQGLVGLFNILISSAAQRDQAEQQYYRNAIAAEQQYQLLLNDRIGMQSEMNENVFVKNYQGRLKDGVAKLNDANKAYQASIAKLSEGRAKIGQSNGIDAGNIGKGIGSGVAVGATVGSLVPVIGTAIGAVAGGIVGGLVGLFGGKKKQDEFGSLMEKYPNLVKKGADGWEELDENLAATLIDQEQVDENTKQLLQNTIEWQKQIQEAREQIKGVISELAGGLGDSLRDNLVESFKAGEDAAQAFGKSVGQIIEDMVAKLLFNQVFAAQFDQLQKEMQASMDGGDGDWVDDLGRFYQQAGALSQQFNDGLAAAQKQAESYGIKIFQPADDAATKKNTGLSGAVKGVSEETASILSGQLNAMRISQAETAIRIQNMLMVLSQIETNTRRLESIDETLKQMRGSDPLRSKGLGNGG